MIRSTLSGMLHRKLRLLLSGLAVVLGVMFVAGSLLLTDMLGRSFERLFADVYDDVDVLVQAESPTSGEFQGSQPPAPLPDDLVDRITEIPGVAQATGTVDVDGARLIGADGSVVGSFGAPRLGVSWHDDDALLDLRQGHGPTADDEIAISASLADSAGVSVGDQVGVLTLEPRQDFTVVGIFGFTGGRDSLGGAQIIAFTPGTAQELMLGSSGVWSSIDVRAEAGVSNEQLRDNVAAELGDSYQVATGAELAERDADSVREGLAFFNNLLLGFAGVALFVGIFLIINTFSIIVAQRTRELALTRALGASRRQVLGSVMLEALIIGLLASAFGLAAGVGVGALLAAVVSTLLTLPTAGLSITLATVITAFTIGTMVTLAAAVLPALRASRIPPVAAMQEAATADRPLTRITIAGAVVLAAGGALLGVGLTGNAGNGNLWAILGGVVLTFIGMAVLTPLLAGPVVAVVGRLFSWSVPGRLGRLNSTRNPRRTAITAAALMVGVALVAGVGVVVQSAKVSLSGIAEEAFAGDLIIAGDAAGPQLPSFDPATLPQIEQLPDVTAAVGLYQDFAQVNGEPRFVSAPTDLATVRDLLSLTVHDGRLAQLAPDEAVVDERTAAELGLAVGDQIEVQNSRGEPRTFELVGVYEWDALYDGLILPPEAADQFAVPQPALGFVSLADGADVDAVQAAVAQLLADSPEVSVIDQTGFIDQINSQLDFVTTTVQVLLALAILIAILGIVNTLALSVLERTRELGLLRAVGLGRAATMRMVTVESVVISLFGALLGVVVGTGLGSAVVRALADDGINQLAVPWGELGTYLILAAVVGVVAATVPAVRAARVNVLRAIASE